MCVETDACESFCILPRCENIQMYIYALLNRALCLMGVVTKR